MQLRTNILLALALALVACSRPATTGSTGSAATGNADAGQSVTVPSATGAGPSASASTRTGEGSRPDENGPPEPLSLPLVAKVCAAAPCSGEMSRITVWRSKQGKVRVLEHAGDIRRCSHPPTVFFDTDGKELGAIPLVPVVPGSDEAKKYDDIRTEHTRDLVASEKTSCPDAK